MSAYRAHVEPTKLIHRRSGTDGRPPA